MANNYIQWSQEFLWPKDPNKKAEARAWLKAVTGGPPDSSKQSDEPWRDYENLEGQCDFGIETDEQGFLVYSEECGDLEAAILLVQEYFYRFDRAAIGDIEWASTCSKMRPGGFGGGAVVFTYDDCIWNSSAQFVHKAKRQINQTKKRRFVFEWAVITDTDSDGIQVTTYKHKEDAYSAAAKIAIGLAESGRTFRKQDHEDIAELYRLKDYQGVIDAYASVANSVSHNRDWLYVMRIKRYT